MTRLLLAIGAAVAVAATRGQAQERTFFPVELTQGFVEDGVEGTPDVAFLRFLPSGAIGERRRLRVGPVAAVGAVDGDAELYGGPRVSYRVLALPFEELGIDLAAEALWGTEGRRPVGLALGVDVDGLLRLSVHVARELDRDETFWQLAVGADPTRLGPVLFGKAADEDSVFVLLPPSPTNYYDLVAEEARIRLLAILEQEPSKLERMDRALRELGEESDASNLREALRRAELPDVAESLQGILDEARAMAGFQQFPIPDPPDDVQEAKHLAWGWRLAVEQERPRRRRRRESRTSAR